MRKFFCAAVLLILDFSVLRGLTVDPGKAQIVVPPDSPGIVRFAAKELQRHLKMKTSKELPIVEKGTPGKYLFLFARPAGAKLKPEEARWEVGKEMTRLYGDSFNTGGRKIDTGRILQSRNRTGDLTAVYAFLEDQLGFLFLAPGDRDTAFTASRILELKEGNFSWDPGRLVQREMRFDYGSFRSRTKKNLSTMPGFYQEQYKKDYAEKDYETLLWLKKMRQGRSVSYGYGHAFTRWWELYGRSNPEFFALIPGGRKPRKDPARIKMCVSNPKLVKKIIDLWKAKNPRPSYINVCENDSGDYCQCKSCRALDIAPEGDPRWAENLTDRYVYFANAVAREARKTDPDVKITFYAYSVYRFPPQKFRVEPNIIIGFVPGMLGIEKVQAQYEGWRKMGATMMFQRPNDQHINTGLPLGIEKRLFDHFQVGYKNGIIGTDYDSIHRFWDTTGIADYILARAHIYPRRSFEEHFKEYCSGFGNASAEVKAFFSYWRKEIFENRLLKNKEKIIEKGRYGNFRRGLMWDLGKYYFEHDFDVTDRILERGLSKKLTPEQRSRLTKLFIANLHSRKTCRAIAAGAADKIKRGKELLDFRISSWKKINMSFYNLFDVENEFGDVAGIKRATYLSDYEDGFNLPLMWRFSVDPKNELTREEIWKQSFSKTGNWRALRLDSPWEQQHANDTLDSRFRKLLSRYDGSGWYALELQVPFKWWNKEVALLFGAVDESAWVYLNGKLCGTQLYKGGDDWKKPFIIPITQHINWKKKTQTLFVRVEDKGGLGGLWRPVMLICREKK